MPRSTQKCFVYAHIHSQVCGKSIVRINYKHRKHSIKVKYLIRYLPHMYVISRTKFKGDRMAE